MSATPITDDHKDVLEEFLQRTEAELHSDATLLEIERVKKEIAQLEQKMQRLLDMHLDQKIDFGTYQDKKLEITKTLTVDLFLNQSFMEKYVRVSIVIELVTVGTKLEDL